MTEPWHLITLLNWRQHLAMMAPMCVACRLSLHVLFVCLFILTCFICQPLCCASLVLTYDRASLLNLQASTNALLLRNGSHYTPPPILSSIPGYLCRWPYSLPAWRRRRRWGKRGGTAIKLRLALLKHSGLTQGCDYANRTESITNGRNFSPQWCEQRENLKQLFWRDCSWFICFIK